jgi:hypothetical protein
LHYYISDLATCVCEVVGRAFNGAYESCGDVNKESEESTCVEYYGDDVECEEGG